MNLVTCWVDGVPAGYFELDDQDGDIELAYFGLLPGFIGLGLGGVGLIFMAIGLWFPHAVHFV